MANLKLDLIENLNKKKYYDELELVRLAQEPNMNYEIKVTKMVSLLEKISILNAQIGLANQYFQDTPPVAAPENVPQPQGRVHQGQSHGE